MSGKEVDINDIWPVSGRRLRKGLLQSLDRQTFKQLCRRVRARELINSGSQRHAGTQVQKLHKLRDERGQRVVQRRSERFRMRHSELLHAFCPDRKYRWRTTDRRRKRRDINLEQFSFLDNPDGTVRALCELAAAETEYADARLNFLDEHMLDIGPYIVLGLMGQQMAPFVTGGKLPQPTRRAIEATELASFLGISPLRIPSDERRIVPFRLQRRGSIAISDKDPSASPSTKEKVTSELLAALKSWLSRCEFEMTPEGEISLASLCNEILENAERHAHPGGTGDWAVSGLMERRSKTSLMPAIEYVCNFAFVNLGFTIAETIEYTESPIVKDDLQEYQRRHASRAQPNNVLATLFAAQDGMTRKRYPPETPGGLGLMSAVEAVAGLTHKGQTMGTAGLTIISGSACIQFSGKYLEVLQRSDGDVRRFQWLSSDGSPRQPPDHRAAFPLPVAFPGTIITARFILRDDVIQRPVDHNDGSDD